MDKKCPRCQNSFPPELFLTKGGAKKTYCPSCTKEYKRQSYMENPDKAKQSAKAYAERNGGKVQSYQEEYRRVNRMRLNQYGVDFRKNNPQIMAERESKRTRPDGYKEKCRETYNLRMQTDQDFRDRTRSSARMAARKYYASHRASILESAKRKYLDDVETSREKSRLSLSVWRKRHPDMLRATNARRKAIKRCAESSGFDDIAHRKWLMQWQQSRCYHCNSEIDGDNYHLDHIVPISKGGQHSQDNLAISCPRCNLSKNSKILNAEWVPDWFISVDNPFVFGEEVDEWIGSGHTVKILSTFFLSERNGIDSRRHVKAIRESFSEGILLFDWEWIHRNTACKNMILNKIGKSQRTCGARECSIAEVATDDAREFFDETHVQGFGKGSVYLGLVNDDRLVALSAWIVGESSIELNRFSSIGNVPGAFGRLTSSMKNHDMYFGQPIVSFVDQRYANGHGYEKAGFTYAGETDNPIYYYVNGGGLHHRRQFRKNTLDKRLTIFDASISESDNAKANGFYRMFGLKQKRYILNPDR